MAVKFSWPNVKFILQMSSKFDKKFLYIELILPVPKQHHQNADYYGNRNRNNRYINVMFFSGHPGDHFNKGLFNFFHKRWVLHAVPYNNHDANQFNFLTERIIAWSLIYLKKIGRKRPCRNFEAVWPNIRTANRGIYPAGLPGGRPIQCPLPHQYFWWSPD